MVVPKVSVIIPVYNVEPCIERCLHSLFGQTLEDIEYIFVDDGSSDNSAEKIKKTAVQYPSRKARTKIICHSCNQGVAAARTSGIRAATGEYIIHCDPDDYVELDMYEEMYSRAVKTDADIVACRYWTEQGGNRRVSRLSYHDTPAKCLKYLYKKDCDTDRLWDKLVRRELIEKYDIVPYPGINYAEDLNCIVRIFHYAKTITVVDEPFYHYCIREDSLSNTGLVVDDIAMRADNIERICHFLECADKTAYRTVADYLKFYIKMKYREASGLGDKEWFDWYRECHRSVLRFDENSLKSRMFLWLALQNYPIYSFMKRFAKIFATTTETTKKRVFFLLFSMNVGGVEKSLLGLLSTLEPEKYDVHVGLLKSEGALLPMLPEGVVVHDCFCGVWDMINQSPLLTIKSLFRKGRVAEAFVHILLYIIYKLTGDRTLFYKYVLRNEPQIAVDFDEAHAYAGPASMLDFYVCRKIKAGKRYGWIHFDVLKNGIDEVMTRRLWGGYDKIYVVSEAAKHNFVSVFPEFADKTEVRCNIVVPEDIKRLASDAPTFMDGFCGKRILTVGRISGEKGQDVAVEALRILIAGGYDVKWYFVGDGKLRSECEDLVAKYGLSERVEFLGMQINPYGYMRDCDVYVQPSRHEGYCITLAEARCFTAPIVATDFTGAKEQLATYPQSIVTGMGAEEIAEGVKRFL